MLQVSSIVLLPVHLPPLPSLLIIFVLVLVQVPPPHDAEQVVVSQEFHSQFIGGSRNWDSIEKRVRCHCANQKSSLIIQLHNNISKLTSTVSARLFTKHSYDLSFSPVGNLSNAASIHRLGIFLCAHLSFRKVLTRIYLLAIPFKALRIRVLCAN